MFLFKADEDLEIKMGEVVPCPGTCLKAVHSMSVHSAFWEERGVCVQIHGVYY